MEKIRIQKFFTDNAVMSRRAAEAAVEAGRVLINDQKALIGQKIDPECDIIKLDGKVIKPILKDKLYIMLNKPRGYVTTLSDERGRSTVATLVSNCGARVYPVGRLDMDSEGLLLLTNDGELTLRLTHPAPVSSHKSLRTMMEAISLSRGFPALVSSQVNSLK